jgi:hypothetical protein
MDPEVGTTVFCLFTKTAVFFFLRVEDIQNPKTCRLTNIYVTVPKRTLHKKEKIQNLNLDAQLVGAKFTHSM